MLSFEVALSYLKGSGGEVFITDTISGLNYYSLEDITGNGLRVDSLKGDYWKVNKIIPIKSKDETVYDLLRKSENIRGAAFNIHGKIYIVSTVTAVGGEAMYSLVGTHKWNRFWEYSTRDNLINNLERCNYKFLGFVGDCTKAFTLRVSNAINLVEDIDKPLQELSSDNNVPKLSFDDYAFILSLVESHKRKIVSDYNINSQFDMATKVEDNLNEVISKIKSEMDKED